MRNRGKGVLPARRNGAEIGNIGGVEDSSPLFSKLLSASSQLPKPHTGTGLAFAGSIRRHHPAGSRIRCVSECLFLRGSQCFVTRSSGRKKAPTISCYPSEEEPRHFPLSSSISAAAGVLVSSWRWLGS